MNNIKKVTHYLTTLGFGGIEQLTYDLSRLQNKRDGFSVDILVLKNNGVYKDKFHKLGIDIHAINSKGTYGFKIHHFKFVVKTFMEADVIHLHSFHLFIAVCAVLSGKKIIFTEHGLFSFGKKKRLGDYINHFLRRLFYNFFCHKIICISSFIYDYLNENWKINKSKLIFIYNGINLNRKPDFEKVKLIREKYNDNFLIGTTSRLAGFKKIDRLIYAFKTFMKKSPNATLVIVGEGPEVDRLKSIAGRYLNDSIYFLGYKSDPINYQCAFDLCVFPSMHEPFGLVAVESYSVNSTVLVFRDGGGLKEIVSLFNPEDICDSEKNLVEKLDYYYRNGAAKINKDFLYEFFSIEKMENSYYNCYGIK